MVLSGESFHEEEQIVRILRETDQMPVAQVAKKNGVSEATIYTWRKKCGEMEGERCAPSLTVGTRERSAKEVVR